MTEDAAAADPATPLSELSPVQLLELARTRSVRALAQNSVTAMTYDMIADMVIKAARTLEPSLDDLLVAEAPVQAIMPKYEQQDVVQLFNDPIGDLWEEDNMYETIQLIERLLLRARRAAKQTLRGQIIRRPIREPGAPKFALVISVLNYVPNPTEEADNGDQKEKKEASEG